MSRFSRSAGAVNREIGLCRLVEEGWRERRDGGGGGGLRLPFHFHSIGDVLQVHRLLNAVALSQSTIRPWAFTQQTQYANGWSG